MLGRASACLGAEATPWLRPLCIALSRWPATVWSGHSPFSLADALSGMPEFLAGFNAEGLPTPHVRRLLLRPSRMLPRPFALANVPVPRLHTEADLGAWLGVSMSTLDALAGPAQRYREATPTPRRIHTAATHHYRCLLLPKRRGGFRLIEEPLPLLKRVQRHVLDELLNLVPTHEAAHGFVPGRNVASHAAMHANQAWVFSFDLTDFFACIGSARVHALFQTLGYAPAVAARLTTLCTTRTPAMVRERLRDEGMLDFLGAKRLAAAHLPQGAPTSPALANLCAFSLDLRLDGLARRFGARYSRYADDLVISGPECLGRQAHALRGWVTGIVEDEGFRIRRDKTRAMPSGGRQQVTGVVVNERPNLARDEYDLLRARLHRLGNAGPVDGELRAQCLGRIAWAAQFVAPARIAKLHRLFDRIQFNTKPSA
ncbi:MAG: reverse transcriptase family protein [Burkholderiaceae bacterium]